jgi:aminocarboxymuconate-semialdehyde decarboxylase
LAQTLATFHPLSSHSRTSDLEVIDFHSHFAGAGIAVDASRGTPPSQGKFWAGVTQRLSQEEALLASLESSRVSARVLNTSLEFVLPPGQEADLSTVQRINDAMAEITTRHPHRLYGLATVDAYRGEESAKELVRAVRELGLRGVFIESAKGDLLPDAPVARPTFAAAAELNIPVFLHPVPDAELRQKFRCTGKFSERLARSAINSAALLSLVDNGVFEEIPNLHVVVTALALGGLMVGECMADGAGIGANSIPRRNVYVDTTGIHPHMVRAAADLVGADHVVTGTDWPVVTVSDLPGRLASIFQTCGFSRTEQELIAGGNARRLLGV